jgi:CRISPR-associated endonuclease/helicase Cas3
MPDRWQVVAMSATPGAQRGFGLDDDDRRNEQLALRLRASKPIELGEVKVSGGESARRAHFADECAKRALPFATPGRCVGVIVNRVATAHAVFASIQDQVNQPAHVFVVTGRMRPLDRDDLDREVGPLVRSGRRRDSSAPPVIVVSTQCIEAGADFDFDAIVTECASLDALRQRFGRLNRLGEIPDAHGVVVVRSDALGKDANDPIYGDALAATWKWLELGTHDFGVDAMGAALPEGEALAALLPKRKRAPVMLPAHLDAWVQTQPSPIPDPDVSLWLHGISAHQQPEVQVVWRGDLTEALLSAARASRDVLEVLQRRIEACAPVGLEAISVPLHAVRAWLRGDAAPDLGDVEGCSEEEEKADRRDNEPHRVRLALMWKGDQSQVIEPDELRSGVTIVVPSSYGGIANRAWDPSSDGLVTDLGDRARFQQTQRPTLRLHPEVVERQWPAVPTPPDAEDTDANERASIDAWLEEMKRVVDAESWIGKAVAVLTAKGKNRPALVHLDAVDPGAEAGATSLPNGYFALTSRGRTGHVTSEDDGASHTGVEVTLREHLGGVASWAQRFAEGCGLPPEVVRDVDISARWHDVGKVDGRFQRMLHGGSAFKTEIAREPIAKSALDTADRAARARASEQSRYPRGTRHELSSVALMLEAGPWLLSQAKDRDLVLHLVGSHHGHCRPFAPVVADPEPVPLEIDPVGLALDTRGSVIRTTSDHSLARLDSGVAERFWRLTARYGWFGLAWLEAILRLADHRRSEEEQLGDVRMSEAP